MTGFFVIQSLTNNADKSEFKVVLKPFSKRPKTSNLWHFHSTFKTRGAFETVLRSTSNLSSGREKPVVENVLWN